MADRGYTLLEIVIVICLIGILGAIGFDRLQPLRIEAERTAVEQVLGGLRAAVAIELVSHVAADRHQEIAALEGSNPMDHLMQVPSNYLGEFSNRNPETVPRGRWYFDPDSRLLTYRVRNHRQFSSELPGPARARFRVSLQYQDRNRNGRFDGSDGLHGASVVAVEPYAWHGHPDRIVNLVKKSDAS